MNTTVSDALRAAPYQLNIWFGCFLWITGNIGCAGNMIVFRSEAFRQRAYSIYLFCQALSDLLYFDFVLLTRVLERGFQIPITIRYDFLCKTRQFVSVWGNQVSFTLFAFATIDRLLSTQRDNRYRQWSNRFTLAYKMIIGCLLIWFILICHRLILYKGGNGSCGPADGIYADYDIYFEVIFTGICPPILMSTLAYLLIVSVRKVTRRQILPLHNGASLIVGAHRTTLQQIDIKLSIMIILQSIISVITYFPYAAELIYSNVTQYYSKSALQKAQDKVFVEFMHLLSYTFFASGFYISIITNNGFRREIRKFIFKEKSNISISTVHTQAQFIAHTRTQIVNQPN